VAERLRTSDKLRLHGQLVKALQLEVDHLMGFRKATSLQMKTERTHSASQSFVNAKPAKCRDICRGGLRVVAFSSTFAA
jgi:hypothetical protein